ncbi:hypothetical protein H7K45_28790 [Mycobacterium yunnanensis]|uniref:Uncharacterized protein n=1 Tax=Mycobacterium yunnanensis TaxID=368477 RepID=A0A9X2ZC82_9MYCO|nr:hypothetical protein [Mycobacterium yunnanensis]MCV7424547.1 hypothetical protein [Mycobacterium yunnanensis]
MNPADFSAVVAAVQALLGQFAQSFLTTPDAIRVAVESALRGDVNGAFASLEGLIINPLVNYAFSPFPQQAANAIARYLPSQLGDVVRAAPGIFLLQGARTIDLYTSARRSVVDAVQGVISSLGTFNPVAIAGAVAAGLGNVFQTAVASTFGANGAFSIAHDLIANLISAAFPDQASTTTAVVHTALATRNTLATTSGQSAADVASSPSTSSRATSATTDDTASVPVPPARSAVASESKAADTSEVTAGAVTAGSAEVSGGTTSHSTADEAKSDDQPGAAKTVDVTSGNKVEPKTTADSSATPRSASTTEPSDATAASAVEDSTTTAKSETGAGTAKATSSSATP